MIATREDSERNPRGQGELLRERLLEVATELVDSLADPSRISIRAVTRAAGVSPTAFYLHFERREELMTEVVNRCFASFRDAVRAGAATGTDPGSRLQQAGLAYIAFARAQPARYALIFGPHADPATVGEEAESPAADEAFDDLLELVRAYARSDLPADRVEALARGIWTGIHGYVTLCECRPHAEWPSEREFTRELMDAWLG